MKRTKTHCICMARFSISEANAANDAGLSDVAKAFLRLARAWLNRAKMAS